MFVEPKQAVAQGMKQAAVKANFVSIKKSPRTQEKEYVAKDVATVMMMGSLKKINALKVYEEAHKYSPFTGFKDITKFDKDLQVKCIYFKYTEGNDEWTELRTAEELNQVIIKFNATS
jgi:hypothetical protein